MTKLRLALFLVVTAPGVGELRAQTLYEIAVEIDSLYGRLIDRDSAAAEPFFDALRTAGRFAPSTPARDLKDSVTTPYLRTETALAFSLLDQFERARADSLRTVNARKREIVIAILATIVAGEDRNIASWATKTHDNLVNGGPELTDNDETFLFDYLIPQLPAGPVSAAVSTLTARYRLLEAKARALRTAQTARVARRSEAPVAVPLGVSGLDNVAPPIIIQNQVGGSAQSAIIDGTAKWIAERMRQELSIAFFDRFESWADRKNISLLFPNTLAVLKSSATTDYTLMMEIFKRAFTKDLDQLTFSLPHFLSREIVDDRRSQELLDTMAVNFFRADSIARAVQRAHAAVNYLDGFSTQLFYYDAPLDAEAAALQRQLGRAMEESVVAASLRSDRGRTRIDELSTQTAAAGRQLQRERSFRYLSFSLEAIDRLRAGDHPASLISHLSNEIDVLFPQSGNLKATLLLLGVFSESLIAPDPDRRTVWAGRAVIDRLSNDARLRSIYFGLVTLRAEGIFRAERSQLARSVLDALPEPERRLLTMSAAERHLAFDDFMDYALVRIDEDREAGVHPAVSWDRILESYRLPDTLLRHLPRGKVANRERFGAQLQGLIEHATLPRYEVLNEQISAEVRENADRIRALTVPETGEEDAAYRISNHLEALSDFDAFFATSNSRPVFFGYPPPDADRAALRDGFYTWYQASIERLDEIVIDPAVNRPVVDSLVAASVEWLLDLHEFCRTYDLDPVRERAVYQRSHRFGLAASDSLRLLTEIGTRSPVARRGWLEMKLLDDQREFVLDILNPSTGQQKLTTFFNRFLRVTGRIDRVNAELKALRERDRANFGNPEFIHLIKNSMEVVDLILDYALDASDPELAGVRQTIRFAVDNLLDAYVASLNKDYNGVVMNIVPVVQQLVTAKHDKQISSLEAEQRQRDALAGVRGSALYLPRSRALDTLRLLRDDQLRKMQEVFKYCTFIAAVAESQGSDDVKRAINAIALPVGSYSIKRRNYSNISLNAYPGVTAGYELVQNADFSEWAPNFGFTAPIGIALNWGYRTRVNERRYESNTQYRQRVQKAELDTDGRMFSGHSGSVFFSLIDLGALVLFRLNDSNEPLPEDVGFQQIFSPGVMYVHGLPRMPISIMGGLQMTPRLRTVGEDDAKADSYRLNLSVVVDLPIANFYTRRRSRR